MIKNFVAILLSAIITLTGFTTTVSAAVVTTQEALAMDGRQAMISQIDSQLARQEVRHAMIALGVDPVQAQLRVATLNDQELVQLSQQMENLPAGSGTLAVVGAVFVVILILELFGITNLTNIFNRP